MLKMFSRKSTFYQHDHVDKFGLKFPIRTPFDKFSIISTPLIIVIIILFFIDLEKIKKRAWIIRKKERRISFMKFSCAKDVILNAVTTTAKASSSKSTVQALEGLLMELNDNSLAITGYNLEIGIRTEIQVENGVSGSTIINAKMLSDIIRKMPSGTIDFDIDDGKTATISKGATVVSVMCMRADEYPPVPQTGAENGFTMPQKLLKSMINQTKYACATTDTKPALTGCLFDLKNKELCVAAVDGIRIALRRESVDYEDISFIVPAKTLDELVHLLSDEDDKNITVCVDKNQISFEIDNYTMISRLINGEFVEYEKHFMCNENVWAEINCREIIEVLDRSMLFVNEKNKVPLRCMFNGDSLTISCETTLGRINDKINIKYNGDPVEIGFNTKLLLDAFKATDSDTVKMILSESIKPIILLPMEGREFSFLLLPMRLK